MYGAPRRWNTVVAGKTASQVGSVRSADDTALPIGGAHVAGGTGMPGRLGTGGPRRPGAHPTGVAGAGGVAVGIPVGGGGVGWAGCEPGSVPPWSSRKGG